METGKYYISAYCSIAANRITVNGELVFDAAGLPFPDFAKQAYQHTGMAYPKFFKMDNLSKLAFLAAGVLLEDKIEQGAENNVALLFANKSSSLDTDLRYNEMIADRENYFPSPAVFVYTLPNICLGEISIRYKLFTENTFFIFADFNPEFFAGYAANLLDTKKADEVLCGWIELCGDQYRAFVYRVSPGGGIEHNVENIKTLYNK